MLVSHLHGYKRKWDLVKHLGKATDIKSCVFLEIRQTNLRLSVTSNWYKRLYVTEATGMPHTDKTVQEIWELLEL